MNTTLDEPPSMPKKTAFQHIQEQLERQMRPLREVQELQDLVQRYSTDSQLKEFAYQFDVHRQVQEVLDRLAVPTHLRDIIDGLSVATQATPMMERYLPKNSYTNLGLNSAVLRLAAELDPIGPIVKQYEMYLKPLSEHQSMLEMLQRQALGGTSAINLARRLEEATPAFRAMEEAKRALDRLWPTFSHIDFSQFETTELDKQETRQAAESITQAAAEQASLQAAVEHIVLAIQAEPKPSVQLLLLLIFRKVLDWLIAGTVGAVMGYYAPAVLGESPQAARKAVQENARVAVGSPQLLAEYRYVSTKVLIVRQNPGARSPEVGCLSFGKAVRLVKKDKDFALVLWTDKESGAEIQGWVFSRYLGKFN